MRIEVTFTHRGFFYGCPVLLALRGEGFFPIPLIPLTGWWLTYVAPVIQAIRNTVIHWLDIDTPERDLFAIERVRELRRPRVRAFDWPEETVRDYLAEGD